MNPKKITVLAVEEDISIYFKQEIERIFQHMFEVDYRSSDMETPLPIIDTDLVLYTDPLIFNQLAHLINVNAPVLMMRRTITRDALRQIKKLPSRRRVLVANLNEYMANEMTALILQLGVTHLRLYPFYPGATAPEHYDCIVTPTRYPFLPEQDKLVVETGNRVYDISLILDILSLLQVEHERSEEIMYSYMSQVPKRLARHRIRLGEPVACWSISGRYCWTKSVPASSSATTPTGSNWSTKKPKNCSTKPRTA